MAGEDESAAEIARVAELLHDQRTAKGTDLVEDFFSQPIPQELWHYTDYSGLEGILSKGRIWATEARHTTDASEFVYAKEVAQGYLSGWHPDTDNAKAAKEACSSIVETEFATGILSPHGTEVFVASFSAARDAKSQWMDYANRGKGVSIALDLRGVRPPKQYRVAVTLAPCIYIRDQAEKLVKEALGHFVLMVEQQNGNVSDRLWVAQHVKQWKHVDRIYGISFSREEFLASLEQTNIEQLRVALTLTEFDLLRLAGHCKHPYYLEEKEWRLSLPHTIGMPLTHINVEHRGPKHNIPYVAHDLFQAERLPITQVMLGPLCDEVERIEHLLEKYGYRVPILKSEAPIRKS